MWIFLHVTIPLHVGGQRSFIICCHRNRILIPVQDKLKIWNEWTGYISYFQHHFPKWSVPFPEDGHLKQPKIRASGFVKVTLPWELLFHPDKNLYDRNNRIGNHQLYTQWWQSSYITYWCCSRMETESSVSCYLYYQGALDPITLSQPRL